MDNNYSISDLYVLSSRIEPSSIYNSACPSKDEPGVAKTPITHPRQVAATYYNSHQFATKHSPPFPSCLSASTVPECHRTHSPPRHVMAWTILIRIIKTNTAPNPASVALSGRGVIWAAKSVLWDTDARLVVVSVRRVCEPLRYRCRDRDAGRKSGGERGRHMVDVALTADKS